MTQQRYCIIKGSQIIESGRNDAEHIDVIAADRGGLAVVDPPDGVSGATHFYRDGSFHQIPDPPSTAPCWVWDHATATWVDITPPVTREGLRLAAAAERDRRINGGFIWSGSPFKSDDTAQARIATAAVEAQVAPSAFPRNWLLANGAWRSISAADAAAILAALTQHQQAHFDAYAAHDEAISETADDNLAFYDVTHGWP